MGGSCVDGVLGQHRQSYKHCELTKNRALLIDFPAVQQLYQAYSFAYAADNQATTLERIRAYQADVASDHVDEFCDASEASYHDPTQATGTTQHSAACHRIAPSAALPFACSAPAAFFQPSLRTLFFFRATFHESLLSWMCAFNPPENTGVAINVTSLRGCGSLDFGDANRTD
jgi:hypothetical protein